MNAAAQADAPSRSPRREGATRLLLVGGGAAHAQLLARLARLKHQGPAGLDITLLVPPATPLHEPLLPAVVAGRVAPEDARLPFAELLQATQARCVVGHCLAVEPAQRRVHVRVAGETQAIALPYQLLSLDTAPDAGRESLERRMPGAREHALLRHPSEGFLRLWPDVLTLAQRQAMSLAVVGSGTDAVALVFALAERLRAQGAPGSTFTLVSDGEALAQGLPEGLRRRVLARLRRLGIHVLAQRCVGFTAEGVRLDNGGLLCCDAPVLAPVGSAPGWLQRSGLLSEDGAQLSLDRYGRHRDYANILASGPIACCPSGEAARVGSVLAHNVLALHAGSRPRALRPAPVPRRIACGTEYAIAAWGPLTLQGRWLARRQERQALAFLSHLRPPRRSP